MFRNGTPTVSLFVRTETRQIVSARDPPGSVELLLRRRRLLYLASSDAGISGMIKGNTLASEEASYSKLVGR
jgi:hypothetical protein